MIDATCESRGASLRAAIRDLIQIVALYLRLMTSLRTRTVSAWLMLKRPSATTRQSGRLRQMGRLERTLFTLDWINDEQLRKTTTAELNKGESRNSLVRAVNLHSLGRFRATAARKPVDPIFSCVTLARVYILLF